MTDVIVPVLSGFLGGGLAAILNHLLGRAKTTAEIQNLQARTQRMASELRKTNDQMELENEATRSKIELNKATIAKLEVETDALRVETRRHKAELGELGAEQDSLASDIDDVELLFATVLTEWERKHLRKLNSPDERFPYRWNDGFKQELSRLLALKFIDRRPERGIRTAMADGRADNNLHDHFSITEKGKHFLHRLDELEQRLRDIET
jgi:chromosome segregation ATPase